MGEKRMFEDKMLDNEELMRVKRNQKEAIEEEERARARESEQNTMKEYDAEKKKRLMQDKYIDNMERQRVIREAKQEDEWRCARARSRPRSRPCTIFKSRRPSARRRSGCSRIRCWT